MKQLSSGLFTYDEQLNVVANLAKEVPTPRNGGVSDDGLTYRIEILDGTTWSDGTPLTAEDFVFSMRRALDPRLGSPYAPFFHSISGARDYNNALSTSHGAESTSSRDLETLRERVGVYAEADKTVVYRLTRPDPSFLTKLALWTAYPVRRDIVETHGSSWTDANSHVGNGPFVLNEWKHGEKIVITRNPHWHGEAPALRRIEILFIADQEDALAAYDKGELDVVKLRAPAVGKTSSPGSALNNQTVVTPALTTSALFMNNEAKPFNNPLIRKAFGMAIDRDLFVTETLQGAGKPTTSWLPPGMPGYNPRRGAKLEFDAREARQILHEAGYVNAKGLELIKLTMATTDASRVVGEFIRDQLLSNLGVNVSIEYVEGAEYGRRFTTGDYQLTVQRWSADWPYPDNWLPSQFTTDAPNNVSKYSSRLFDQLMAEAASEVDNEARLGIYDQAHRLLLHDAALVPLYNEVSYTLVRPNVQNLKITSIDGAWPGDNYFAKTRKSAGQPRAERNDVA